MTTTRYTWTPAQDAQLRALRDAHRSWEQIAAALQMSRTSCQERARAIGLRRISAASPSAPEAPDFARRMLGRDPLPAGHPWALAILDGRI